MKSDDTSIPVTGSFSEGGGALGGGFGFGGFGGGPNRSAIGILQLTKSGTKPGDEIIGSIDLRIVETHGGLFQPQPQMASARQPMDASAISLQRAFDTNRDGIISADEIEKAAKSLRQLDLNNDGKVSAEELQGMPTARAPQPRPGLERRRPEPDEKTGAGVPKPDPALNADPNPATEQPVVMTTDEDHRNMMAQLGITKLRPGPNGNADAPNHANYDEASANPYPDLPKVLTLNSGDEVATADQWSKQRRPEIIEAFEREVLGRIPPNPPRVAWEVKETREAKSGDIETIEQHITGVVDNSACPEIDVRISMSLTLPKNADGPVPVLMMFGFTPFDPIPPWMRGRGPQGVTPESQLIAAGWGYAKLNPGSVQDDAGGFRAFGPDQNQPKRGGWPYAGNHRSVQSWTTTKARRLGRVASLGLGSISRTGLSGIRIQS